MSSSVHGSEFADEWFEIADRDLERARRRTVEGDWEDAGFRIQQAVEKYLKAYLAAREVTVRYTHDLDDLLDDVCEIDNNFGEFREPCIISSLARPELFQRDRLPPFLLSLSNQGQVEQVFVKSGIIDEETEQFVQLIVAERLGFFVKFKNFGSHFTDSFR